MVNYYIAPQNYYLLKSMKVNKIMALRLILSMMLIIGFASCTKKSSSKKASRATGWNVDGKKGASGKKKQEAGPGLVFVEGGTFTMGKVEDDVMHDWNNTCLLYTSPSPRDGLLSRMPSSA